MNPFDEIPDALKDLIDEYCSGSIDEAGVQRLEQLLSSSEVFRQYFIRYARLQTDLEQIVKASHSSKSALRVIESIAVPSKELEVLPPAQAPKPQISMWRAKYRVWSAIAATLLIVSSVALYFTTRTPHSVAWIMNAQNCQWVNDSVPTGDLSAGKILKLERGLVEVSFASGANVVLEGPCSLELLSNKSARLFSGKLTARVPENARGFSIISPQGKIVDLGTEFGVSVAQDGATDIFVFKGEVKALCKNDMASNRDAISVIQNQSARIDVDKVSVNADMDAAGPKKFVRHIQALPIIAPRILHLDFQRPIPGTLSDALGQGTGLTHRLLGTGEKLLSNDIHLKLNSMDKQLELTTTNSDINRRFHVDEGEYLGFKLSELGFTGVEDFAITVTLPNIPALNQLGQFGLYAGSRNDRCIRGGLIGRHEVGSYKLFMANNNGGDDSNAHFVGLQSSGEDLRMTLKRESGKYFLTMENLSSGSGSTINIKHPDFLDSERDLFVGLFGANTQSEVQRTLVIKELVVTVWASSGPVIASNP